MAGGTREIISLQVTLGCDRKCESCSKYFDCTSSLKRDIYDNPVFKKISQRMKGIKHKIAVMSGKGGVGKSTLTANLGAAISQLGYRVGILDSDFYGPSIPTIMGVSRERLMMSDNGIVPVVAAGDIKVASVASVMMEDGYVTWLGDLIRWALQNFLGGTIWGELDFLFIDLPPGTGEETLNVMKIIKDLDGGIIVTIPSQVSQIVVGRGISLCKKAGTSILGLVENMGSLSCPNCNAIMDVFMSGGGERIARKMDVPFLGTIPLDPAIALSADRGEVFVLKHGDSQVGAIYREMGERVIKAVLEKEQ